MYSHFKKRVTKGERFLARKFTKSEGKNKHWSWLRRRLRRRLLLRLRLRRHLASIHPVHYYLCVCSPDTKQTHINTGHREQISFNCASIRFHSIFHLVLFLDLFRLLLPCPLPLPLPHLPPACPALPRLQFLVVVFALSAAWGFFLCACAPSHVPSLPRLCRTPKRHRSAARQNMCKKEGEEEAAEEFFVDLWTFFFCFFFVDSDLAEA